MRRMRKTWPACFLAGAAFLSFGCSNQDANRLARVGHKLAARAQALAGSANGQPLATWPAAPPSPPPPEEMTLASRVSARLHWDKALANTEIRVKAVAGEIELQGKVETQAQRSRAAELAESTNGVAQVINSLEVPARDP